MIYSQQYQDSQFSEQLLTNHHPKPTLLYCTPPPSPMANNLGHPNRSCVSCKKRKVKCDRKTPSCAACLKSKHRCQYTSYSPPEEPLPSVQDEETMRQQHWIQNQRMNQELKLQPMVIKNEYDYFNDNSLLGMNIENLVPNSQYAPIRYQPQQLAQLQQNLAQQPYILQQQCQQIPQSSPLMNRNIYNSVIQPVSPVIDNNNCMRATITLNYNLNGLAQMAQQMTDPLMTQYLQSVTKGAGPSLPPNGFVNVSQLQFWIYEKILALSQEWICDPEQPYVFDPEEKLKLRLIDEQQGQFSYVIRQQFDVVIDRAEYNSGDGFDHQNGDYKPFDDLNQYDDDRHSENSNRSSIDLDSTDIFLQKIYAFVRKFMKDVPWLRENFLLSIRDYNNNYNTICDGVISDVAVEIRKNHSPFLYSPQQNRPSYPVNNDMYDSQNDIVKGRLCF